MILRGFRARIREGCIADFERMVQEQSIPWLNKSDGMIAYFPGKPIDENSREFAMVTLWRDLDSVKKFSGDNWENPVVTEKESPLVEEMWAHHYEQFGKDVA